MQSSTCRIGRVNLNIRGHVTLLIRAFVVGRIESKIRQELNRQVSIELVYGSLRLRHT